MSDVLSPTRLRHQPPLALLVDRDSDTRQMYAECLRQSAYQVDEAEDGREALAKSIALQPDIIVTETRLPGLDGFQLCSLLRTDVATRDVTIVFVTGDAYAEQAHHAEESGADAVLVKPCLPETLVAEIGRLLAQAGDLRNRGRAIRELSMRQGEQPDRAFERARPLARRPTLSRAHARHDTTTPPVEPPALVCPACDRALQYQRSHLGGVNAHHPEQWDYYECAHGCGTFQYRQRTRKLRRVP